MSWYGTVVLMLLVIGGIETNPGPRGVVSDENPNVAKAGNVEIQSSCKRPLELVSLPSKKQRVTERKPTIAQLISALSQIKLKAQIETPLHLLKPHSLPLFTAVCDILKIPNTRKFMDRTKYIWNEYIKANEENSKCSLEKDLGEMLTDLKPSECKQMKNENPNEKDGSLPTLHEPNRSLSTDNLLCHVNLLSKQNEVFYKEDDPEEAVTHKDANPPKMSKNIASEIASKEISEKRIVNEDQPLLEVERTSNESLVLNRDVTEMETEVQTIETESSINTETCVKPQDVGFWEFWITAEDWRKVHLGNGKYSWFTIRELIKLTAAPVFKICLICFKTHRTNKVKKGEPVIVYYGKCKHEGCRQFRFELIPVDDAIKLTVSANGEIRHKGKLSSRLSGLERIAAKQVLLTKKALAFRSEKILKAEAKTVLAGNLLEIRSLDVFRQARAEAAKMSDRHNDDGIDLLMRFREDRNQDGNNNNKFGGVDELIDAEKNLVNEERIIQKVGEPLHVHMFSVLQLKTLLHSLGKRGKTCILHIDSTGSVVRPLKGDKKTVYYYSGCVNVGGKLLPVMDFISCQHDVASITSFFIQFVQFQKKNFGSKRIFSHIVTDFSTALLPAVILAWNRMSVLSYLIKMFRLCTKTDYQIKGIVTVHLCCSHFMHMAAGDFSRIGMAKEVKKFYLCCIASLINCKTFEEFKMKVEALVTIAKSKARNIELVKAKVMFEEDMLAVEIVEGLAEKIDESNVGTNEKKIVYKSSPFYGIGKHIEDEFDKKNLVADCETAYPKGIKGPVERDGVENNVLYNTKFWDLFLTKYMPYAPLWSGFLIRHSPKEKNVETRFSNAPVEGWFKLVKESILDRLTHMKVGRFIERLTDRIKSICKEIYLDIPTAACNKKAVKKCSKNIVNDADDKSSILSGRGENVEEKWMKRHIKKKTYFQKNLPEFSKDKNVQQAKQEHSDILNQTTTREGYDIPTEFSNELLPVEPGRNDTEHEIKNHQKDQTVKKRKIELECNKESKKDKNNEFDRKTIKVNTYGPLKIDLQFEDYESLQERNWLTGAAIDAVAEHLLRLKANWAYVYVSFDIGTRILKEEEIYESSFLNIEEFVKSQYLLMPYSTSMHTDSHWCVVVADLKNKIVFDLNALKNAGKNEHLLEKVLKFLDCINTITGLQEKIDLTDWTDGSETIKYQKQSDNYNCGIFVLYYMMKVVEKGLKCHDTIDETNIEEFRKICSKVLEDPETSFFHPALQNGLIDIPSYYTPDATNLDLKDKASLERCTVAFFRNKNMGKFLDKISQKDFASLTDSNWLTSTIVDFCNATYVKDGQFCFAVGEATFALQEGRPRYTPVFKPITTEFKKMKLIFVPYNLGNHFSLYVIDMKDNTFTHLDPMNDNCLENEKKCNKIKEFLRVRNRLSKKETINVEEMKFVSIRYPKQTDNNSCGVFVVFYVSILSGKNKIEDIELEFDSSEFRKHLQLRCLRLSLPVKDLCLACGNGSDQRRHQWCQCCKCGRWIHYLCMETSQTYERLRRLSTTYSCIFCNLSNL